ncbi:anti-sigma factor [Azospirillum sp. SYSU D00513]|uniref:anti-sigma factor n=1 Tax=Azospirillum sp. SYSU D00513 TaxID=2812561 RepID=UPI001A97202E|nr:anti-sigma factor [Azospirillum sp. SYSU D00513]
MSDDLAGWEAMAAEYVLGTLQGAERVRFEAALASDGELRRLVADWEGRLLALSEPIQPVEPTSGVWKGIAARITPEPARVTLAQRLWTSLALWRSVAVATAMAAAVVTFVALRSVPPSGPALVAVLQAPGGPAFAVRVPGSERVRVTPVGDQTPPPNRAYELWVVPGTGNPTSLGLIAASGLTQVPLARVPAELLRPGVTLAISVEPETGSPTGLPTGPVVYTGTLVEAL